MTTTNAFASAMDEQMSNAPPSKKPKPTRRTTTTMRTTQGPSHDGDLSETECTQEYAAHESDCTKFYQCMFGQYYINSWVFSVIFKKFSSDKKIIGVRVDFTGRKINVIGHKMQIVSWRVKIVQQPRLGLRQKRLDVEKRRQHQLRIIIQGKLLKLWALLEGRRRHVQQQEQPLLQRPQRLR